MTLATEYAFYGIPAQDDSRYASRSAVTYYSGWCHVCRNHLASDPVRRCDLEIARAAEMDDPRWCLRCGLAFDRLSCSPTFSAQGKRDLCGRCQRVPSAWRVLAGPRPCPAWWIPGVPA